MSSGQHGIDEPDRVEGEVVGQTLEVELGVKGCFIAGESEVADAGFRDDVTEGVDHAEGSAENGDKGHASAEAAALGCFQGSGDIDRFERQIRRGLGGQDERKLAEAGDELGAGGLAFPQPGEAVLSERVGQHGEMIHHRWSKRERCRFGDSEDGRARWPDGWAEDGKIRRTSCHGLSGRGKVCLQVSYLVLARKYRPQTFAQVVGQEHVVRGLSNALATGRIAHAFLFVGPRGIGKTSIARILSKALNCAGGPRADFDPNDPICQEIAEGRSLDVIEIDGASNNGVEQVRELRDNVQYTPTGGKFKVYIIDEVHMLSPGAFNALLKTLEEPPAHVKFIFATTEVHKLPATILSRCQRYDLRRIADLDIAKHLSFIADNEGIKISPDALTLLARNAEGGLRDAESALDQLITFCGKEIREQDVLDMFGLTGIREIWALAEAIEAGDPEPAIRQVRALVSRGKDLLQLTRELCRYFRNQLIYHISPELAASQIDPSEVHHFAAMQPLPPKDLVLVWIEELVRLEERIRHALVKEVMFEITMIRLAQQREKVELEHLLRALTGGQPIPPVDRPSIAPVRSAAATVDARDSGVAVASKPQPEARPPEQAAEERPAAEPEPEAPPVPVVPPRENPAGVKEVPKTKGKREISRADKDEFYQDPAIQAALERFEARAVEVREKPTQAA